MKRKIILLVLTAISLSVSACSNDKNNTIVCGIDGEFNKKGDLIFNTTDSDDTIMSIQNNLIFNKEFIETNKPSELSVKEAYTELKDGWQNTVNYYKDAENQYKWFTVSIKTNDDKQEVEVSFLFDFDNENFNYETAKDFLMNFGFDTFYDSKQNKMIFNESKLDALKFFLDTQQDNKKMECKKI